MSSGAQAARGTTAWAARERLRWVELLRAPATPWLVLAVLVMGTGALLMYETRGTTLWVDEWTWLLHRRGSSLSTLLAAHGGHWSTIPILIYKLLFATAGLRHSWPYRVPMIGEHVLTCALLFVYARQRVGEPLALVAAALILVFGPGWENLLWPFQLTWNTSILAGVAALLALDRRDRAGDIAACVLLIVSLASSGIGVPIVIGAALEILLVRGRAPRQWWVVAVPILIYAVWAVRYQHTNITRDAFTAAPSFVATGLASTFAGLAGLGGSTGIDGPGTLMTWGPFLLLAAIALAGWCLVRVQTVSPRVLSLAAIVLAFWVITAIIRHAFANPYSSRYLYVSAVFIVLLAAELARGTAPGPRLQGSLAVLAAVSIVSNLGALRDAARIFRDQATFTRADLAAVDIARPVLPTGYLLHDIPGWPIVVVPARAYFAATRDLGTPAATPAQLLADPESARETADRELISIHRPTLLPAGGGERLGAAAPVEVAFSGAATTRGACVTFTPSAFTATGSSAGYVSITVPPAGLLLAATGGTMSVGIRRFGYAFEPLGTLASGGRATLVIAPDLSSVPWHVLLTPSGRAAACGLR